MRVVTLSLFMAFALAIGACGAPEVSDLTGTIGDDDDTGTPIPTATPQDSFSMSATVDATSMDFLKTAVVTYTITPANGFTGTVVVDLLDAAGSGLRSKGSSNVSVTGAAPVTGTLTIDTEDFRNVIPGPYTAISFRGTSGALQADATISMTINARLEHHIPAGVGTATNRTDAFGPGTTVDTGYVLHLGKKPDGTVNDTFEMRWVNDDAVNHTIHTGGYNGDDFQHGATPTDPTANTGATQVRMIVPVLDANGERTFTAANFYCHVHGSPNNQAGFLKLIQ